MTPAERLALGRQTSAATRHHLSVLLRVEDGDRHDWRALTQVSAPASSDAHALRYAVGDLAAWGAIELTRDGLPLRLTAHGRRLRDSVHRRLRGGGR